MDIVAIYKQNPTPETVAALVEQTGRSKRSIIGTLSKAGVYQRPRYVDKRGEAPITKLELVSLISEKYDIELRLLSGLEKAPKTALKALL